MMALGVKKGDEVIVPDFTFPATALAVTNVGATPVLVDVNPLDYNIAVQQIKHAITEKTKAIIPVHLFGLVCRDMEKIMDLAAEYDLFVVEDAACSLGARFADGKMAGTVADYGCFSLHASKGITTGEGGLICTDDDELANSVRRLSVFGDERAFRRSKNGAPFVFDPMAGNYKMSDITAAIGLTQLTKIERLINWRIKVAKEWGEIISTNQFLEESLLHYPQIVDDHSHIYQSYVAVCEEGKRSQVMEYMKMRGFQCGIGTHACHRYPEAFPKKRDVSVSKYLYDHAISFPRYYGLEVKEEWGNVQ
jgi:dTDP-4-amino-4,6-dideoxygalactose transaminase